MKLEKLIEDYTEAKKQFTVAAQESFKEYLKEFFDANPEIKVIKWQQYTPYFNDGDECVFNVHDVTFSNSDADNVSAWGELNEEREGEFAFQGTWGMPDEMKAKKDVYDNLNGIICSSEMQDIMRAMFGDHVTVSCTREGIDVDDCEHD
jgi:hypothetical protein